MYRLLLIINLGIFGALYAQTDPKFADYLKRERENLPVEGTLLYDCSSLSNYEFGSDNGAVRRVVDVDPAIPFGKAFQLDIKIAGQNSWQPQLQTPHNKINVNDGDILFYVFYTRVLESGSGDGLGASTFYVQKASSPWNMMGYLSLTILPTWRKYYVVAQAEAAYGLNAMEATFHLGLLKQKVEIGGIIALNLGPDVNVDDLPRTPLYYDGMEPEAPWRAPAAARIEQHRKGDLTVSVKDQNGRAVPHASVSITMKKHAYGFGNFIASLVLGTDINSSRYRKAMLELFNCATTPFYMGPNTDNWGWLNSEYSRKSYRQMASWLQRMDIPAKGHVLVWPGWQWMPSYFEGLQHNPEALRSAINDFITEVVPVGQQRGVTEWDVVNEPYSNHDVMDILGEPVLIDWFNTVHSLAPNSRLNLNEYNIITDGGNQNFQDNLARIIELLQTANAPLGGIGMQCHFNENLTGIPRILSILDRFATYHLPIQISEFDIDTRDETTQAAYLRDFYTAVFSHPATNKIIMWGFYEGTMWKPNGALIRTDWSLKPNYDAYTDLLFNEWWTEEQGETNAEGAYSVRGFRGTYDVTITYQGETINQEIVLDQNSLSVTFMLNGTSVQSKTEQIHPHEFNLYQNYPNPFNIKTKIQYSIYHPGKVKLKIYDIKGKLVKILLNTNQISGNYSIMWNAERLCSGIYFIHLQINEDSLVKKCLLIK